MNSKRKISCNYFQINISFLKQKFLSPSHYKELVNIVKESIEWRPVNAWLLIYLSCLYFIDIIPLFTQSCEHPLWIEDAITSDYMLLAFSSLYTWLPKIKTFSHENISNRLQRVLLVLLYSCSEWRGLWHPVGPCRNSCPRICEPTAENRYRRCRIPKNIDETSVKKTRSRGKTSWYLVGDLPCVVFEGELWQRHLWPPI